jgi:hypothetical protein
MIAETGKLLSSNMFTYCLNNPVNMADPDGDVAWWIVGAVVGAVVGGTIGAVTSYAATGSVNLWAVVGGAAAGALVGCGLGYLADKAVMASSWATAASVGGTSSAAAGRTFEKWYYQFNNVSKSMQQVVIKGIGRVDAITKGKIVDMKNYDWNKPSYRNLSSVVSNFTEQGQRYLQSVGQKVNGQTIKSVEFFFSSKPPQQVTRALQSIGVKVNWIK